VQAINPTQLETGVFWGLGIIVGADSNTGGCRKQPLNKKPNCGQGQFRDQGGLGV